MTSTAIFMIHGYGCTGAAWSRFAEGFRARGRAVETPTIRPLERLAGPPPASLATRTLQDYVEDMAAEVETLAAANGEQPILFGHSMGGLICQKLVERGLGKAAVLMAPASPADARGKPALAPALTFLNVLVAARPETKSFKIWRTGFGWGVLNRVPPARHAALYAEAVHDSGRVLSDLAYPARDPNRPAYVDESRISVPVLVCAGAHDRTTPIGDLRRVGDKYRRVGGDYREYPDNAHWIVDEPNAEAVIADIDAWLARKGL